MSESDTKRFRAFCAYDYKGRAPGCGWERFTDDESEAERLVEEHSERCMADYEVFEP